VHQTRCLLGAFGFIAACSCAAQARADVFAQFGPAFNSGLAQWDGNGRFVRKWPGVVETMDGFTATRDGWLYVAANIIGNGDLVRQRADTPGYWLPATANEPASYTVPGGLTTGPDGSVYATSNAFGRDGVSGVFRFNPADGSFRQVVSATATSFGSLGLVAVAPTGDVYLYNAGVGIERYAATTGQPYGVLIPSASTGTVYDMDFGPDGNLYVSTAQGVDRYQPQGGALISHFLPAGPHDLAFGDDGLVYVNNPSASSILRYDATTGASRDTFVPPDQYTLASPGNVYRIAYLAPEPASCAGLLATATLLLRRRGADRR
jgi:sugar lactone lactonase YvrE